VSLRLLRRRIVLAGLPCLVLAQPRHAFAQAEELPPELAAEQGVPPPSPPPASPSAETPTPPQAPESASHDPTVLFLPYVGFSLPAGVDWAGFKVSPRLGALLGWHASRRLSLNAECDVDYVRPGDVTVEGQSSGASFWTGFWSPPRHHIDVTASPLVSVWNGQLRVGPKLGWFTSRGSQEGIPVTGSGVVMGFNLGLFVPYRTVSVVGLLTGSFRFAGAAGAYGGNHTAGLLLGVLL
jgi:hypothetical protein